jgi:hypothetical protein
MSTFTTMLPYAAWAAEWLTVLALVLIAERAP